MAKAYSILFSTAKKNLKVILKEGQRVHSSHLKRAKQLLTDFITRKVGDNSLSAQVPKFTKV